MFSVVVCEQEAESTKIAITNRRELLSQTSPCFFPRKIAKRIAIACDFLAQEKLQGSLGKKKHFWGPKNR